MEAAQLVTVRRVVTSTVKVVNGSVSAAAVEEALSARKWWKC